MTPEDDPEKPLDLTDPPREWGTLGVSWGALPRWPHETISRWFGDACSGASLPALFETMKP